MILFIISLMIFAKYLQHYMEHTGCYYHLDYVLVKRYHRKDYKMTYEELEKNITKRKIIVRNGRVELPYKYGRIPLYTCGEPVSAGLFRYINKKCHTKIPEMVNSYYDKVEGQHVNDVGLKATDETVQANSIDDILNNDTFSIVVSDPDEYKFDGSAYWKQVTKTKSKCNKK